MARSTSCWAIAIQIIPSTGSLTWPHKAIASRDQPSSPLSTPRHTRKGLVQKTGVDASLHTAQSMGITTYNGTPNYTLVLGTLGVHLLDLTSAYGVFADGVIRVAPHAISAITNTQGKAIYQVNSTGRPGITSQGSFLLTNGLSDNQARTFEFGACSNLDLYSNTQAQCYAGHPGTAYPSAANTGTSQNFADNWTIGYTTDYVMDVCASNTTNAPMTHSILFTAPGS